MTWLRWGALNLGLLFLVMVGGLGFLIPAALVGWGDGESQLGAYLFLWIYLPFTAPVYLLLLATIGRRVHRPRAWALGLTPIFWAFVPIFAVAVNVPGVLATWISYLVYGAVVRLPPARRGAGPTASEPTRRAPCG